MALRGAALSSTSALAGSDECDGASTDLELAFGTSCSIGERPARAGEAMTMSDSRAEQGILSIKPSTARARADGERRCFSVSGFAKTPHAGARRWCLGNPAFCELKCRL